MMTDKLYEVNDSKCDVPLSGSKSTALICSAQFMKFD